MAAGVEDDAATTAASLEFGWVPADAVRSLLEDVGNFRARGASIELLHATVLDVGRAVDVAAVRATLSAFLSFLLRLVADHNFKIAASAMAILEDLAVRLGADLQPYLGSLMVPLIDRLGDSVQMVHTAAARTLAALAHALGATPVLEALGGALVHQHWRVREEGVNAYIATLLTHPKERFDYPACVRAMAVAAADENPRVASAALEAFALLHERLGALLQGLLTAVGAPDAVKRRVAERTRDVTPQPWLPVLDAQGQVEHQAHARPTSSQRHRAPPAAVAPLEMVGTAALPGNGSSSIPSSLPASASQHVLPHVHSPVVLAQSAYQTVASPAALAVHAVAVVPQYSPAAASSLQQHSGLASTAWSPAAVIVSADVAVGTSSGASGAIDYGCHARDGTQQVERSEGSLLNWVRPARKPTQQSLTAPRRGRSVVATAQGGLVVAEPSAAPTAAAPGRDGVQSFVRHGKSAATVVSRLKVAAEGALPLPAVAVLSQFAASLTAAGAQNADLSSSVRNWQQQRAGSSNSGTDDGGSFSNAGGTDGVPSADGCIAPSAAWQDQPASGQEAGLTVEGRSDSLLKWRRPSRTSSISRQGAATLQPPQPQQPQQPASPVVTPTPAAQLVRVGSASIRRTLSSFKKRLFGAEALSPPDEQLPGKNIDAGEQDPQQQHHDQQQGLDGQQWSIAAVRTQPGSAGNVVDQQGAQQAPAEKDGSAGRLTGLTVALPHTADVPNSPAPSQQEQPESPSSTSDKLSKLKRLSEHRRVSSAPITAQLQRQLQQQGTEDEQHHLQQQHAVLGGTATGTTSVAAVSSAIPTPGGMAGLGACPAAEGRPGHHRPSLQALKTRARTARLHTSASATAATLATAAGGSGTYSMAAVEDVFGPDQPVGSPSSLLHWSSLNLNAIPTPAGSSASSSPTKQGALARTSTNAAGHWPDSPTGASWRRPSFVGSTSAGSSPKAGAGRAVEGSAGSAAAFNPATEPLPLSNPEVALQQALGMLLQAALSQKKELDWQAQFDALRTARRLARHHPEALAPALHTLVGLAAPIIDALRSTMSRLAIAVFQELAEVFGPALDAELDVFLPLLLKRAGQVSIAGRDNFLAVEADRALTAVVEHVGDSRVTAALLACLTGSKSPDVRAKVAMHLDACLQHHGARVVGPAAHGSAALVPRLLRAAVGLLEEGRLEARTAGKRMLWELRRLLDGGAASHGGEDFKRALARLDCKTDKVWDVFESGSMPPLVPARQPSASLRSVASLGSGPGSPTAGSYSPTRQSMQTSAGGVLSTASSGAPGWAMEPASSSSSIGSRISTAGLAGGRSHGPARAASLGGSSSGSSGSSIDGGAGVKPAAGGGIAPMSAAGRRASRPASGRATRPASAGTAESGALGGSGVLPSGSLSGVDPETQQRLETARAQLGSQEWKERLVGLEALQAAAAAAQRLPHEAQLWVALALTESTLDANLRVQQQAVTALRRLLEAGGDAITAAAPTLMPALCKCADSGNPSLRQGAGEALDLVVRDWDPPAFIPPLMAALGSPAGGPRGKGVVLDRLAAVAPQLWQSCPAIIRKQVLPALFSLLTAERRSELRQMVQGALTVLAQLMGAELVAAAGCLPPPQQRLVAHIVAEHSSGRTAAR